MKDIRPALREFLLGGTAVAAIVGTRVFPIQIPQGTVGTSVVYQRISGAGDYKMDGPSGWARPRIQIAAWAQKADDAVTLANAVKDRIDGYSGVMGTAGNAVTVQGVFQADEREMWDDAAKLYGVIRDYFVHYNEL